MTVIVGWWSENGGGLAADRAASRNGKMVEIRIPKVRAIPRIGGGNIIFGFTGCLYHDLFWRRVAEVDLNDISTPDIVNWLEQHLSEFGSWLRARGDGEVRDGIWTTRWEGLCLSKEGLFHLASYGEVTMVSPRSAEHSWAYSAVGSGSDVSLGVLYMASTVGYTKMDAVLPLAVEAANEEAAGCGFGVDMLVESWPVSKS